MKNNKLKTIYKILDDFNSYRSTNECNKLIDNLNNLQVKIQADIQNSTNKTFINILEFITDDIQYEIDKAVEQRLNNEKN